MNLSKPPIHSLSSDRELIDRFAERVYRYHLARRGNDHEAEILTRETFKSLSGSTQPASSRLSQVVLVFRTAFALQGAHRHGKDAARLAEADPDHAQDVLFQRAQIAALADHWAAIPSIQADILALTCFGGLDSREVGQVTRRNASQVQQVLEQQSAMLDQLADLAGRSAPPAGFASRLADELERLLQSGAGKRQRLRARLSAWLSWTLYNLSNLAKRPAARIAAGGLVALAAGYGLFFTINSSPPLPFSAYAQTPTPTQAAGVLSFPAPASSPSGDPGILTPPDQATCERWQSSLTQLLGADTPLALINNEPIFDPNASGPGGAGIGCYIDLNPDGQPFRVNMQRLVSFFSTQGFQKESLPQSDCARLPPTSSLYSATRACGAQPGNSWVNPKTNPQEKIVLEFTNFRGLYAPDNAFGRGGLPSPTIIPTRPGEPYPPTRTPDPNHPYYPYPPFPCPNGYSQAPCVSSPAPVANPRRNVVLRLGLAINATEPVINGFISQWAAGNPNALGFLTPDLRKTLPDLNALDRLAGISRRPDLSVKLTWQTVQNSGSQINLQAFVDQASTLALPGRHQGPFQVVLSQAAGQWRISSLARSTDQSGG